MPNLRHPMALQAEAKARQEKDPKFQTKLKERGELARRGPPEAPPPPPVGADSSATTEENAPSPLERKLQAFPDEALVEFAKNHVSEDELEAITSREELIAKLLTVLPEA